MLCSSGPSSIVLAAGVFVGIIFGTVVISSAAAALELTPEAVNAAPLDVIPATYEPVSAEVDPLTTSSTFTTGAAIQETEFTQPVAADRPSPAIARLQILLDRAGASPGVIDGLDGDNLRSAIAAFEAMRGLPVDGKMGPQVREAINSPEQVIGTYVITAKDLSTVVGPIPKDYAEMADLAYLGYARAKRVPGRAFSHGRRFPQGIESRRGLCRG